MTKTNALKVNVLVIRKFVFWSLFRYSCFGFQVYLARIILFGQASSKDDGPEALIFEVRMTYQDLKILEASSISSGQTMKRHFLPRGGTEP